MSGTALVTGSSGLIGSECVRFFDQLGWTVHGIDNNMRLDFFGPDGDTRPNLQQLIETTTRFTHHPLDIRDRVTLRSLVGEIRPDAIIHAAAQPSHDLARQRPFDDFEINAVGTLNLLEAAREFVEKKPFVFLSTNKVYGDAPNELPLKELETRWDYSDPTHYDGINESCRIDHSMHSLFGVSKASADLLVQEYGRCFQMNTVCFRGGCLTGRHHAGAEMHGFLAYIARALKENRTYRIYGYLGKQVRDNMHSVDVCSALWHYIQTPRPGAVYNLGGGRDNSISVIEAISKFETVMGRKLSVEYIHQARIGDHICYISDLGLFRKDYPEWFITRSLESIIEELAA